MEHPQGRILSLSADTRPQRAVVEVTTTIQCDRCAAGKGCGAGVFGATAVRREVDALLPANLALREGDHVVLELAPDDVLQAAVIVYGLPLGGAVLGAAAAWVSGSGDLGAALAALAGIAAGMAAARLRLRRAACLRRFTPRVTRRAEP